VNKIALSTFSLRSGPKFDDFLFASVGKDKYGRRLSVLSTLARSNLDPWQVSLPEIQTRTYW
jgi:hypothetical protein